MTALARCTELVVADTANSNPVLTEGYEGDDLLPNFRPDQVLGRALALVEQIRSSPQARAYLDKLAIQEKIKPLGLKTWSRTRWGGLSFVIERLLYLRKVSYSLQKAYNQLINFLATQHVLRGSRHVK